MDDLDDFSPSIGAKRPLVRLVAALVAFAILLPFVIGLFALVF